MVRLDVVVLVFVVRKTVEFVDDVLRHQCGAVEPLQRPQQQLPPPENAGHLCCVLPAVSSGPIVAFVVVGRQMLRNLPVGQLKRQPLLHSSGVEMKIVEQHAATTAAVVVVFAVLWYGQQQHDDDDVVVLVVMVVPKNCQ